MINVRERERDAKRLKIQTKRLKTREPLSWGSLESYFMEDPRLLHRIPNDSKDGEMSIRHISISKCTEIERPEGNSI